ncbi:hypothetical protein WR25_07552 [Diploscapter pachys]|uniref:Uncharacterized protein n=1 Tax=Diploscapter pachys TaxID=2018661 RepID=A0A2A2JRU0_9BILA|nr:hypothetical protein WR25_07552 [Diploscapter pachys]
MSATSMLIKTASKDNIHSKMYTNNLLTVDPSKRPPTPRVSVDGPSQSGCVYPNSPSRSVKTQKLSLVNYIRSIFRLKRLEMVEETSPERRLQLLRCETANVGY